MASKVTITDSIKKRIKEKYDELDTEIKALESDRIKHGNQLEMIDAKLETLKADRDGLEKLGKSDSATIAEATPKKK